VLIVLVGSGDPGFSSGLFIGDSTCGRTAYALDAWRQGHFRTILVAGAGPLALVALLEWVTNVAAAHRLPPAWLILMIQPAAALANVAAAGVWPEPRYTVPCIPVLVLCLASGIWWLVRWVPGSWRREWKTATGMLICLGLAVVQTGLMKAAPDDCSGPIARAIAGDPHLRSDRALVAPATGPGGSIIAELAFRAAHRPDGITLVRANKALVASGWLGENYALRVKSPSDVQRFLEENCVPVVIARDGPVHAPHFDLLLQALRQYPDRCQQIAEFGGPGTVCRLYHLRNHPACAPAAWLGKIADGLSDEFHLRPPGPVIRVRRVSSIPPGCCCRNPRLIDHRNFTERSPGGVVLR
jgi:hypothetical protein